MSGAHSYVHCECLFGQVPVATSVVKTYGLKNKTNETVVYYVTRSTETNPIYYVFNVNKYEGKVKPGEKFILKMTYSPTIPGSKDFDQFTINDSRQNFYQLSFRGECIGPVISSSVRSIQFFETPKRSNRKQVFALTNSSQVSTFYQFDCCDEQGVFQVEPKKGTLAARDQEYITVRFCPKTARIYSCQLCCLILYHEPILLSLFGFFSDKEDCNPQEIALNYFPFPHDERVGFRAYFSDSVTIKKVPPPVSLSINYLDFGRTPLQGLCQTQTTSFTNHMDHGVQVEWEQTSAFQIYPQKLEIPAKQSALYECRYRQEEIGTLSWAVINGHILWKSLEHEETHISINVPIPITIRFIGHTFPRDHVWISSVSINPTTILLPLTLPTFPAWATFLIQSHGHLPVLYKLVPPSRTNFIMKPMVGLIHDFQIITVQLESNSTEAKSYVEKWGVEVNGQLQNFLQMFIKGQTDKPRVRVGCNNRVRLEPIHPGVQACIYLPVKNVSCCQVQFHFQPTEKIKVHPSKGMLAPNEEMFITCCYSSNLQEHGLEEIRVLCRVQCVQGQDNVVGEHVDIPVIVTVETIYSELCAFPHFHECGEIAFGTTVETSFYLFNFGKSHICFKLVHDHNGSDVTLKPQTGRCGPNEKIFIAVHAKIARPGKNSLLISYFNCMNQCRDDVIEGDGAKQVFRIEYNCVFPCIQFLKILEHNFADYFSHDDLWKLLRIDDINTALLETNRGEIQTVDLHIPESEATGSMLYIVFSVKNISHIFTRLTLKWRQVCFCAQRESFHSLTFRVKVLDCVHRDMISMEISNPNMRPDCAVALTLRIKYILAHTTKLSYMMELSDRRTVVLNFHLECYSANFHTLSAVDPNFVLNMGSVYIGLREPPIFAFWLYNNTAHTVSYKVNELSMTKLNNAEGFTILKCVNCRGGLQPYTTYPLLFRFCPIEEKTYRVLVILRLGMKYEILTVTGRGTAQKNIVRFSTVFSATSKSMKNNAISLSVSRLLLEPIVVGTSTERMFFIRNGSNSFKVKYTWKPCFIEGLVKVTPLILSDELKPRETHPVVIKITSLNEPCCIRVLLCLQFVEIEDLGGSFVKKRRKVREAAPEKAKEIESEDKEKPQKFFLPLPITVNVVGITDRDNCIHPEDQMSLQPCDGITIGVDEFMKKHFGNSKVEDAATVSKQKSIHDETVEPLIDRDVIFNTMEHIVGDALFSGYYLQILEHLKTEPTPLYSQIQPEVGDRKKQLEEGTRRLLTAPPVSELKKICQEVLIDSLQTSFQLGPTVKTKSRETDSFQL